MSDSLATGIIFAIYLGMMLVIGLVFFKKNNNISDFILGGRSLNKWVAAFSAQASDMSGWLLLGLPGTAYGVFAAGKYVKFYTGINEAMWTAIGLALGTYINWLIVAKRLRKYTEVSGNSITLPEFFTNRFRDKSNILRVVSALFILVFFLIYTASQFSAGAKLFNTVFGLDYQTALLIGALIIVAYTFLGGFMAVCWTDFIQGSLMFVALIVVPVLAVFNMGGLDNLIAQFQGVAATTGETFSVIPKLDGGGINWLLLISSIAWGLGYFGQPHILSRFMAIKSSKEVRPARIIAMIWVVITLFCGVIVGAIGRVYLPEMLADGETVFMTLVQYMFPAVITGILLTAILAAVMSTADSQLLVAASAVTEDFYHRVFKRNATEKELVWVSRGAVAVISIIAVFLARDPNSSVFGLVSYAWAGFGSAFGPIILFALFWRRTTSQGAIAGIVSGGLTALIWQNLSGGIFDIYEIVPGFLISSILIIVVSLLTKVPEEVEKEFDSVATVEI